MIPTPLVETRQLGRWRMHAIQAGGQRLDGGAMFGVVPKPLWERRIAADERNRIQLGMRCLLIEHDIGPILIDTGAGNKESDKFYEIYGVENVGSPGPTLLEDGLRQLGFRPDQIVMVIDSHLHFDHAGGNTTKHEGGKIRPTFPKARYVVQRREYEWATHTNERTAASYFAHNFVPIHEAGLFDFVDGEAEIVPGIRALPTPGHTPGHHGLLIESAGERAFYIADLSPTTSHLPLPWIMGYDVEPLVTLETKRRILARAMAEEWLVVFEHDATTAWAYLTQDARGYAVRP
ncbi:MAG TPA: MBL fold metallo-hydrolase [Gemmatimonadaceae bacterium]|nr:MBL fold metallo-hydrolase [Gemmatimonadaceae bacterium]